MPASVPSRFAAGMLDALGAQPPRSLAVALSGGVDSVALTRLAANWARARGVALAAVVVDHGLRAGSAAEACAVAEYAQRALGVSAAVHTLRLDPHSTRMEALARDARRDALISECRRLGADHVLMGHHLNDQVELFVMRLLARSGWPGLACMQPRTCLGFQTTPAGPPLRLVRPLLQFEKSELRDYCVQSGLRWWEDPTNADALLTERNLVRKLYALAPDLVTRGPFSVPRLAPLIAAFSRQRALAERTASVALDHMAHSKAYRLNGAGAFLNITPEFKLLPPAVVKEILFRVAAPLSPQRDSTLFSRKCDLHDIAERVLLPEPFKQNVLGVEFSLKHGVLRVQRENWRRDIPPEDRVFEATAFWSDWTLLDNRFWLRWRLPIGHISPRLFSVTFLRDIAPAVDALQLDEREAKRLIGAGSLHPFLQFERLQNALSAETVIGFPTLDVTRNLETEWRMKGYEFEP